LHFISFYLHCISFFGTVFKKNCTAPSQSELIEKFFHVYYSNSHNVYQTYEIDGCCSLNLQKSSFNFTRELDIRIPCGYNLKRFCQSTNLICRAVTTGGFRGAPPPPPPAHVVVLQFCPAILTIDDTLVGQKICNSAKHNT
jgi:hypothetical protein